MESVWHQFLCVMAMTTAGTPAMRRSARLPPAASTSSAAMTLSASPPFGVATVTRTAKTSQTSPWSAAAGERSPRNLAAQWASSSVGAGSVSTWTGNATEMQTARINLMKQTVVSWLSIHCIYVDEQISGWKTSACKWVCKWCCWCCCNHTEKNPDETECIISARIFCSTTTWRGIFPEATKIPILSRDCWENFSRYRLIKNEHSQCSSF